MRLLIYILITITFASCSTVKTFNLMRDGSTKQLAFKQEIPFEYRMNLIVIKPIINGKQRDMIFDTGAPNVMSSSLSNEMKLKEKVKQKSYDSQGAKSSLSFVSVPEIKIGNIDFINTCAAIADFDKSPEMKALNVDGIIGANLMKYATWYLDFENMKIVLASSADSIKVNKKPANIKFVSSITGTPKIEINFSEAVQKNITFDTGSNGDFICSLNAFKNLKKKNKINQYISNYGTFGSGLYGHGKPDSNFTAVVSELKIGETQLGKSRIDFNAGDVNTIGLNFLSNYNIILDWKKKNIALYEVKKFNNLPYLSLGFSLKSDNGKVVVANVIPNTDAERKGLKIGAEVIGINALKITNDVKEIYEIFHSKNYFNEGLNSIVTIDESGAQKTYDILFEAILK